MASDRDNNGMIPQNWRKADVSKIQSAKITSKDDNIQLFNGIKQILSEAVNELRGTANDDKVKYIVDLIMLRVRSAIETQLINNNDILLDQINSSIAQILASNTKNDSTQQVNTEILTKISESLEFILNQQNDLKQNDELETDSSTEEQIDVNKNDKNKSDLQQNANQNIQILNIQKIEETLNKNIKKLEETINKGTKILQKFANTNISSSSKQFSKKQFNNFIGIVVNQFKNFIFKLNKFHENVIKHHSDTNEQLIKINKTLDKLNDKGSGIFGIVLLLLAVGGLALLFFWDKIKAKIDEWKKTSKIWQSIQFFITQIKEFIANPITYINGLIKDVIASLVNAVKTHFAEFFSNPLSFIQKEVIDLWNNFKMFGTDVWNWVTGAKKEVVIKKDESEQNAAKLATDGLNNQKAKIDETLTANQDQVIQNLNQEAAKQNEIINNTTKNIENDSNELNIAIEKNATDITKNANAATDNLEKNTFANLESNVTETTDASLKQIDDKTTAQIDSSTKQLNDAAAKIEKTAAANGPPTNVDKTELDKMQGDATAAGGNVDVKPGEKPKMPTDVVKNTTTEQGKTATLYSNKKDVEEANKNTAEIAGLPSNSVPDVKSAPEDQDASKNIIENKLVVVGPDGKILDVKALQEKRAAFDSLVEILSKNEKEMNSNNKLLNELKGNINNYFTALNDGIRQISQNNNNSNEKQADKKVVQNTMIIAGGNNTSDADLEDM